jgi:hypothetical protein
MPRLPLNLLTGSNLDVDATSVEGVLYAINMYQDRSGAWKLFPGLVEAYDTNTGTPIDGMYRMGAVQVAVSGGKLWRLSPGIGAVYVGTVSIIPGTPVSFADDGTSIFFAGNSQVYETDGNTVGVFATAAELDGVTSIVYHQNFLLMNSSDPVEGDTWYTDKALGGGWNPLEQYNNQLLPDTLLKLVSTSSFIYNFGPDSTEVTFRDGAVPFSVNPSASISFGLAAKNSVDFDGQSMYFLSVVGQARRVVMLQPGGSPQIISFPVDLPIDEMDRVDDAYAKILTVKGQTFYVITFPSANVTYNDQFWPAFTIAYHAQLKNWIQLGKWNSANGVYEQFPLTSYLYLESDGQKLCGGIDGIIYDFSGHSGERGVIRTGHMRNKDLGIRKRCDRYTYDVARGLGDYNTEQFFIHRWRDDSKQDWEERRISLGKLGQTDRNRGTTETWRCGVYFEREHEFVFDAPTDVTLNAVIEDVQGLK